MGYNSGVWHLAANFFLPNLQNWARNLNSHLLMQIKNSLLPHTHKYNHEALKKSSQGMLQSYLVASQGIFRIPWPDLMNYVRRRLPTKATLVWRVPCIMFCGVDTRLFEKLRYVAE